jgi:hypothetical protein
MWFSLNREAIVLPKIIRVNCIIYMNLMNVWMSAPGGGKPGARGRRRYG